MDINKLFNSFYDKLLLRDIIGKVVPGAILIFSIFYVFFYNDDDTNTLKEYIFKLPFFIWILLTGISWILSFALQFIGEKVTLLKVSPKMIYPKNGNPGAQNNKTECRDRKLFYKLYWIKFNKNSEGFEKIHAERLNIIKEACGNGSVSIFLSSLFISYKMIVNINNNSIQNICIFLIIAILLSICLWRAHVIHIDRYGEFLKDTIEK